MLKNRAKGGECLSGAMGRGSFLTDYTLCHSETGVSQPRHCHHLGLDNSLLGNLLSTGGYLAAPLGSVHWMPLAFPKLQ